MLKRAAAAFSSLILLSSAAMGAGPGYGGLYIGAQGGGTWVDDHEDYQPDSYYTFGRAVTQPLSGSGATLGFFGGYDAEVTDMFVLGIAGDVNWDNTAINAAELPDYKPWVKMNWDASIKAKFGAVVDDTLLYATLGYGWANFSWNNRYFDTDDGTDSPVSGGVQVGLGVEKHLLPNLLGKVEATWTNYGSYDVHYEDETYWRGQPTALAVKAGVAVQF